MSPTTINVSDPSNTLFTQSDFDQTITELVLGTGWTDISSYTFSDSSMVVISIPSTLTTISDYAFYNSKDLTTIHFTFDSTLTTIGIQAFENTQLSVIYLPSSLTTIGDAAFQDSALATVYMYQTTLDRLNENDNNQFVFNTSQSFYGKDGVTILNLDPITRFVNNSTVYSSSTFVDISGVLTQSSYVSDISMTDILSITIGTNVTSIGDDAFRDASGLNLVNYNNDGLQLTSIGNNAFENTNLAEIRIPSSVATIGQYAFQHSDLSSVTFGIFNDTSLTSDISLNAIGQGAFADTLLASIDIPTQLTAIESNTFANTPLTNVYIPPNITNIGENAFGNIPNLTVSIHNATIDVLNGTETDPSMNISLGTNTAFYGASNANIITPASTLFIKLAENNEKTYLVVSITTSDIVNIDTYVSDTTNVVEVNIGTGVINIGDNFIKDVTSITKLTIPNTVLSIGSSAFSNASGLTELNISSSVTNIALDAFNGMSSLTKFIVDISNVNFTTDVHGVLFNKTSTSLIHYPDSNVQTVYDIPSSTVAIAPYSFQDVSSVLTQINVPPSVIDICSNAFVNSHIERVVFDESTNVDTLGLTVGTSEYFYDISTNISFISKILNGTGELINGTQDLSGGTTVNVQGYSSIGANAFLDASNLINVKISGSVTSIGANAFKNASSLSSVFIPSSVTSIGENVFDGALALTSIYIPPSVTDISSNAFAGASSLTNVYMLGITASGLSLHTGVPVTFYGKDNVTITPVTYNSSYITDRIYNNLDFVNFMKTRISNLFVTTGITSDFPAVNSTNKYISYITRLVIPGYDLINLSIYNKNLLVNLMKTIYSREMRINVNNLKVTLTDGSITINIAVLKEGVTESMVPICFPAGTLVTTDQGSVSIEELDPDIHTIRGKPIVAITQTTPIFKHITCIQKDALGMNIPNKDVYISNEHKVFYKGKMVKAVDLIGLCQNVTKVPYNGETLYNVLLEKHDKMIIHNLICETLDPENIMAKICKGNHSTSTKNKIFMELNKIIKTNDVVAYKNVCDYLSKQL